MSDKLARALRDTLGVPLVDDSQAIGDEHHKKAGLKTTKRQGLSGYAGGTLTSRGGMYRAYARLSIEGLFFTARVMDNSLMGNGHALSR